MPDPGVGEYLTIDEVFDLADLCQAQPLIVREVEPETIRTYVGTLLFNVIAEHVPQRPMQQVGAGVMAPDRVAPLHVDRSVDGLPRFDMTVDAFDDMAEDSSGDRLRIADTRRTGRAGYESGIAQLATRLGIERSTIENDEAIVAMKHPRLSVWN